MSLPTPLAEGGTSLPLFLTAEETATLLRTSRKAVYAMADRHQLPGLTRVGRRLLVRSAVLLDFLARQGASSSRGDA